MGVSRKRALVEESQAEGLCNVLAFRNAVAVAMEIWGDTPSLVFRV